MSDETKTSLGPLDIRRVMAALPHRYPMLLVDRVLHWEANKSITAIKNVTVNEEFFNGHFPHKPVMPGVLMVEALAQTAAILSFMTMGVKPDENSVVYFVGIDGVRFKRPVEPGPPPTASASSGEARLPPDAATLAYESLSSRAAAPKPRTSVKR